MAKKGVPSSYTPAMAAEICRRITIGESLRAICSDTGMPKITTVIDWRATHPTFAEQYARAREDQADHLAEEILDVARMPIREDDPQLAHADIANRRLQVDALKWRAAHLRPKTWGDKITQEHTGAGGGPIQVITGVPDA